MLSLFVGACQYITDPPLPESAERFSPPAVYARWWSETEACSGITGSLAAITWYSVPSEDRRIVEGEAADGYWSPASNRIVLVRDGLLDGGLVRHEMLHALVRQKTGHSRAAFLGRCAGVVDCGESCVRDAGPPPPRDPAAATVPPESITVAVEVMPNPATTRIDGGVFTVSVMATNHASHAVVVMIPSGQVPHATSYQVDMRGPLGTLFLGVLVFDSSAVTFLPGETKRQLFDFVIGADFTTQFGAYMVRGAYGGQWSPYVNFTLSE